MVCSHEGFSAAGTDFLRRKDASPATNEAAVDAKEPMVLAFGERVNIIRHRLPFLDQLRAVEFAFRDQ